MSKIWLEKEDTLDALTEKMMDDMNGMLKAAFIMMGNSDLDITSFDCPDGVGAMLRSATAFIKHSFELQTRQNQILTDILEKVDKKA